MSTVYEKNGLEMQTSNETLSNESIEISEETLKTLCSRTKELAQTTDEEFWVYVLRNDLGEEQLVEVGQGHKHGIVASPEVTANSVAPLINEGYEIVCDYHNHPQSSKPVYIEAGLDYSEAMTPSITDIDNHLNRVVASKLGIPIFPRIIGMYTPEEDSVEIVGIKINRNDIDSSELEEVTFESATPNDPDEGDDDDLGIVLTSHYTRFQPLLEKGIISLVEVN